ncbi:hypothetical protein K7J14_00875 [Treponema zuelzerae]|uniref:DUF8091 domain-containing protein n=1 Tax=Teretinema zuelzerae TaxID=156 RepID=A0AAE3JIK6_9SPIR|nr:hypothetical protein [Teretinema zuelzerae]MCD1653260.1 hypothetical protein [Teretinema zuelzerae]
MINTWNESLLHEELKDYYCGDNGLKEVPIDGSICDILAADGQIIEIQTKNLSSLSVKIEKLLTHHQVKLIHPIPVITYIETYTEGNVLISKRKSPKKGSLYSIFPEITKIWRFLPDPKFTLLVVLAEILEIRIADGKGSWRRKGVSKADKKLLKILDQVEISSLYDLQKMIPEGLSEPFTRKDLRNTDAGKNADFMAWVLHQAGMLELVGKQGNAHMYRVSHVHRKTGRVKTKRVPAPIAEEIDTVP